MDVGPSGIEHYPVSLAVCFAVLGLTAIATFRLAATSAVSRKRPGGRFVAAAGLVVGILLCVPVAGATAASARQDFACATGDSVTAEVASVAATYHPEQRSFVQFYRVRYLLAGKAYGVVTRHAVRPGDVVEAAIPGGRLCGEHSLTSSALRSGNSFAFAAVGGLLAGSSLRRSRRES